MTSIRIDIAVYGDSTVSTVAVNEQLRSEAATNNLAEMRRVAKVLAEAIDFAERISAAPPVDSDVDSDVPF